jgi:ABC-2 type transport system permease protein
MNKLILKCIAFLNPILLKTGVDPDQLQHILKLKLMMDDRRPSGLFVAGRNANQKTQKAIKGTTIFFNLLMGVFIGLVLFINKSPYIGQSLYFVIFMVLMALTMISDFTSVLMDVRDHYILLPRPVNDRTIAVSRIFHIGIYVLKLALLQGIPGLIMIGFVDGLLAVPLFFVQILEATFLSILLVNLVYLVLMKVVSPEKFKDVISYFQIGFSVFIFAAYYLLPKLISVSALENISLVSHWWAYLLPPVWITALNELLIHPGRSGLITIVLAAFGLIVPVFGLWFVARVLAPGFNRQLAILATSDGNSDSKLNLRQTAGFTFVDKIANFLAKDPVENAGFKITQKLASRTRDFKLKVYPALAYVPIYFLYFAFNGKANSVTERINDLVNGRSYVFLIYLCSFVLSAILSNITMSEKYKSSWVYYALPIGEPGKILSGMYKAILVFYFVPYCLVIGLATVAIWGIPAINDIILAFLISVLYGMLMALFIVKGLPFSKPVEIKQGAGKIVTSLMVMGVIGGIGYLHYLTMKWEMMIWIMIVPMLLINFIMFYYYKKQTWANIELSEV